MNNILSLLLFFTAAASFAAISSSELECSFDTTPFDEGSVVEPVSVDSLDLNAYSGKYY